MSNLGFSERSYRTKSLANLHKGVVAPLSFAPTKDPAFWEDALYVAGKPEEWLVKALASPFTNDPAFQFGAGRDLYDQANFSMLLRRAGAPEGVALGAGLASSVVLDPLNLIGVGVLSKAGKIGKLAKTARAIDALETLEDGTKIFSKSKLIEKVAELEKITGEGAKRAGKAAKDIKKQINSIDVLNQEFVKLQKTKSLDQITLADDVVGQVAKGQRSVLSVGIGNHVLARPFSRTPALSETVDFGLKGKSASKLVEYPYMAGGAIKKQATKVLNKFGAHIPVTQAQKNLKTVMTKMMQNIGGDAKEMQDEILNVMNRARQEGISREDMMDIIKTIEGPDETIKRTASDILANADIDNLLHKVPAEPRDVEKIIRRPIDELYSKEALQRALDNSNAYKSRELLVYLTPDEFLQVTPDIGKIPHEVAENDPFAKRITKIDRLRKAVKDNDKLSDIPFLSMDDNGAIVGHEGRHRALLAKELGYDRMPVRIKAQGIRWSEQLDPKNFDYDAVLPKELLQQDSGPGRIAAPFYTDGPHRGQPVIPYTISEVTKTKGSVVPSAIDITPKQQSYISPALVGEDEALDAVNNAKKADFGTTETANGHQVYVDKNNVVVKLNKTINKKLLTQNLDIPGITPWKVVDTEDGRVLVGQWHGGTLSINKAKWTREHLDNLEKTAAMLAQKGYALGPLTPADVLVGSAGEVQIINPEVLRKVPRPRNKSLKKIDVALQQSMDSITGLTASVGDLPRSNFDILNDTKTARTVSKSDFKFSDNSPNAERLTGSDTIYYSNARDLVESANNTGWIKTLDDDTIKAMDIDKEVQRLGETGSARPIQVTVDDRGNLEVKEGGRRLAAALLAGFDDVPVERVPYTGEIAAEIADQRVVTGPTRNATDIIEDLPQSVRFLPGSLDDFTVQDVRFLGEKGVVPVGGNLMDTLSKDSLLSDFELWYTRQSAVRDLRISAARADSLVANQQSILASGLESAVGAAGQSGEKTLLLADLLNQSDSPEEFFRLFRERTGSDITYGGINRTDRALLNREFAQLKGKSDNLLRAMAEDGIFVPSSRTPEHIGIASRNTGLTGHYAEGNDLVFLNETKTNQELSQLAKAQVQANAADLSYDANVIVKALDETKTFKGIDIVGDAHPWTDRIIPANSRFFIENEDRARLAEQGVALWNDPKIKEIIGESTGDIIKNKGQTFFVSRSGALVLGRQNNVEELMFQVFGEGTKHAQEVGAVTKDTIYMSNVFGSMFSRFTEADMKPFINRLRDIAKKFDEAGFDRRFRVSIEMPFEDAIAKQIINKNITLDDLLSNRNIVKIPESFEGVAALPVGLPNVVVGVGEKIDRITSPKVRDLAKWVMDKFDEVALKELEAGMPLTYTTNYYARILSPELMSKMDALMTKFMGSKSSGLLNWYNKNLLKRRFTDLRTDEVNDLFKEMQKQFKLTGTDIVEFGKKEDSAFMRQLAAEAPEALEFFTTDPFKSVAARLQVGLKSVNTIEANKAIIDPANGIVVASITKGEMNDLKTITKRAASLGEDIDNLKNERSILRGRLETADSPEEVSRLTKNLEGLQTEIEDKSTKLIDMADTPIINDGFSTSDLKAAVDSKDLSVVMSSQDANRMVKEGLISEDTILTSTNAPMVKVNLEAIPDGATVHLMDQEVADNLVTRFGQLSNDPQPVLKAYDNMLNIWKNWTLFPIPKYHVRNFFSNFILGWLGRIEPKSYEQAGEIYRLIGKYTSGATSKEELIDILKGIQIPNDLGEVVDGHQLYSAWIHNGGITGGLHVNELGMDNIIARKSVSLGFSPASELVSAGPLLDNALLRTGRKTAEVSENWSRFAAFIDGWTKSGSFEEAGLNMKKIFYNYNDLNAFERNVLRRVIPFYSWSRHNIPRMLETMVTQPILHYRLAQLVRNVEQGAGGPVNENEIPAWLRDRFHVNIGRNDSGQLQLFIGDGVVPMVDAYRFISSAEGALDMVKEGLTPFLKVPIEQVLNKSFFTMKEIERAPGEPARSFTLQSIGFTRRATNQGALGLANIVMNESLVKNMRVFSALSQFVDDFIFGKGNIRNEDPTLAAKMLDLGIGRVYSVDTDRAVRWDNIDRAKKVARAKAFIKEGRERNRPALEQYGRARLTQLEVIRDE